MKEKETDLREQIIKSLDGEEACPICGYRVKLTEQIINGRLIKICFNCHRKEILKKYLERKKCKEVKNEK